MLDHAEPTATLPAAGNPDAAPPGAEGCFKRWSKNLGPAGPMAAVMIVLPIVGGLLLLGFVRQLAPWLKHHASAGAALIFAGAAAGLAGFSLMPTYALEIVAGWAFGPLVGTAASVAGLTGAAVVSYGVAKAVVHDRLLRRMHGNDRCEAVRHAMVGSGSARAAGIVALVRLAPVVPFGATNLLMASAGCPLGAFVVGTALGTLPRTAAVVFMASQMSELRFEHNPWLFVASLVATVVVVTVLGYVAKRALAHVTTVRPGPTA
jgi:uncharacterized membrane protein YdjX (TVP38/TMEM64 family)